jgi:hypothetical protein
MDIEELKPKKTDPGLKNPVPNSCNMRRMNLYPIDVYRSHPERRFLHLLPRRTSPEGFILSKSTRVKHSKFGVGRVRSVEGMAEDQKATIIFQTVGVKRLKVAYAQLEILE